MSRFTCILLIHRDTDCARAQFFTLERRILHHTRSGRVNGSEKNAIVSFRKDQCMYARVWRGQVARLPAIASDSRDKGVIRHAIDIGPK